MVMLEVACLHLLQIVAQGKADGGKCDLHHEGVTVLAFALRFASEGTLPTPSILEEPIYFTDSDVLDKDGRQLQADVPKPGNLPIVAYK